MSVSMASCDPFCKDICVKAFLRITSSGFIGLWKSMAALTVRDTLFGLLSREEIEGCISDWAWSAMALAFNVDEGRFRDALVAIADEYADVLGSMGGRQEFLYARFAAAREMCRRFALSPVHFDSWYRGARDVLKLMTNQDRIRKNRFRFGVPIHMIRRNPLVGSEVCHAY